MKHLLNICEISHNVVDRTDTGGSKVNLRKSSTVERVTKKVGQSAPTGKVIDLRDSNRVEVLWDDGHTSIISRSGIVPVTAANRPSST